MMITGKDIESELGDSVAQYYSTTQQTQPGVA